MKDTPEGSDSSKTKTKYGDGVGPAPSSFNGS
jgi:hypothetical protein